MKKSIIIALALFNINMSVVFCSDKHIDNKLNKFISNNIESKQILLYIEDNYKKLESKDIKSNAIKKVIKYNEKNINYYEKNFIKLIDKNIKSIQNVQNLKSEICLLNDLHKYENIYNYEFKFIDNKPELMKGIREVYINGYKVNIVKNTFMLEVNYDFFKQSY